MKAAGYTFNIIRHRGTQNEAQLESGHIVRREEEIFFPDGVKLGYPMMLKTPGYDNHFVYLDPANVYGHWFAMCTCGSPAVIINKGLLVCMNHATKGVHIGDSKWT
jgi:hypothetical protein